MRTKLAQLGFRRALVLFLAGLLTAVMRVGLYPA